MLVNPILITKTMFKLTVSLAIDIFLTVNNYIHSYIYKG